VVSRIVVCGAKKSVMADADDYESLPQTSSVSTHMLAGAAAGIMEHCVMYPVDCVKVCVRAVSTR